MPKLKDAGLNFNFDAYSFMTADVPPLQASFSTG